MGEVEEDRSIQGKEWAGGRTRDYKWKLVELYKNMNQIKKSNNYVIFNVR